MRQRSREQRVGLAVPSAVRFGGMRCQCRHGKTYARCLYIQVSVMHSIKPQKLAVAGTCSACWHPSARAAAKTHPDGSCISACLRLHRCSTWAKQGCCWAEQSLHCLQARLGWPVLAGGAGHGGAAQAAAAALKHGGSAHAGAGAHGDHAVVGRLQAAQKGVGRTGGAGSRVSQG